jgi:hypothetical protein
MQSKGNAPTASQKAWREAVRELGCVIDKSKGGIEIHHVLGATAKHNKVDIGHWFILPLSSWYHRENPTLNVTDNKRLFEANFGTQVQLFMGLIMQYEFIHERVAPVPAEVIDAIRSLERLAEVV